MHIICAYMIFIRMEIVVAITITIYYDANADDYRKKEERYIDNNDSSTSSVKRKNTRILF